MTVVPSARFHGAAPNVERSAHQSSQTAPHPRQQAPTVAARLVVSYLKAFGCDHVFGVPGGAIEPLYDALAASARAGGPRPVSARHEAGAAFMADGYAREKGGFGACCATSGPGATNLLTGVASAYENRVPLLVLTGQPALPLFGRRALQESACTGINTVEMFRYCTRYSTLVSHPDQVEHKLVAALTALYQKPTGPVHLSFPVDVLRGQVTPRFDPWQVRKLLGQSALVDETAIRRLFGALGRSARPAFVVGGGCRGATDAILALAEELGAPFVTTPDGKGLIHPRHPLYRGVFGFARHPSSRALLEERADLVVAAGVGLEEWNSAAWSNLLLNGRLVHVDEDAEHFSRSPMALQHVSGRTDRVFERLLELHRERSEGGLRRPTEPPPAQPAQGCDRPAAGATDRPITPQQLMHELSARLPPATRFVVDTGNGTAWAVHDLEPGRGPRRDGEPSMAVADQTLAAPAPAPAMAQCGGEAGWLRVRTEFAPMGWAIGAAVGAARAHPASPVVCITGDGSYLMSGQELTTAVQERLAVVFVVLNDGALGMVKHGQRLAGAEPVGFELPPVHYAMLARSMGAQAGVIERAMDFDELDVPAMLSRPGPTLLDVRIDPEAVPPIGVRLQTLGSAP